MLLVLAEESDAVAAAVVAAVGVEQPLWLSPKELLRARVVHRISGISARTALRLGGVTIDLGSAVGVLNRLTWLPPGGFVEDLDREYAAMESHALVMSILRALPGRVVNPPSPPTLAGPALSEIGWFRLAAGVGLPVRGVQATTDARRFPGKGWPDYAWGGVLREPGPAGGADRETLPRILPQGHRPVVRMAPVGVTRTCWVVGEEVIGQRRPNDPDLKVLAGAAGCSFLEVGVADNQEGRGVIVGVDPIPESLPGEVVDRLADFLCGSDSGVEP